MIGTLPTNLSSDVSYRGNAFVYEDTSDQLGFTDLSGGWCTGNEVGESVMPDHTAICIHTRSNSGHMGCHYDMSEMQTESGLSTLSSQALLGLRSESK